MHSQCLEWQIDRPLIPAHFQIYPRRTAAPLTGSLARFRKLLTAYSIRRIAQLGVDDRKIRPIDRGLRAVDVTLAAASASSPKLIVMPAGRHRERSF